MTDDEDVNDKARRIRRQTATPPGTDAERALARRAHLLLAMLRLPEYQMVGEGGELVMFDTELVELIHSLIVGADRFEDIQQRHSFLNAYLAGGAKALDVVGRKEDARRLGVIRTMFAEGKEAELREIAGMEAA